MHPLDETSSSRLTLLLQTRSEPKSLAWRSSESVMARKRGSAAASHKGAQGPCVTCTGTTHRNSSSSLQSRAEELPPEAWDRITLGTKTIRSKTQVFIGHVRWVTVAHYRSLIPSEAIQAIREYPSYKSCCQPRPPKSLAGECALCSPTSKLHKPSAETTATEKSHTMTT